MNPRAFCEEPGYPFTLLLTYSLDPMFFERVVLRDLNRGGSSAVLVLTDQNEIERALVTPGSGLLSMGRSYVLEGVRVGGAFHPKLFLRLGPAGGLAWIGTGNLTHGGWGANRELALAWALGPASQDPGGWVAPLIRRAMVWTRSPLAAEALHAMVALDWVAAAEGAGDSPLLFGDVEPIGSQIESRWAGRRFERLRVLTGSTDRSGAMLRWARDTFGVRVVEIALSRGHAAFDPEALAGLGLEIRFVSLPRPPLHAKLFWFDGPDDPAVVVGSPNCSAAAWTAPAWRGPGNVEAACVFDTPDPEAFRPVLSVLDGPSISAADLLRGGPGPVAPGEDPETASMPFRLTSLAWEPEPPRVIADFWTPAPPPDALVELVCAGEVIALTHADSTWVGPTPEAVAFGRTLIARARIALPGQPLVETPPRWLDMPHLLRQAMSGRRYADPLEEIRRRPASQAEEDRQVRELGQLAQEILTDASAFRDPVRLLPRGRNRQPVESARLVTDPGFLIGALGESPPDFASALEAETAAHASINGIFHALFSGSTESDEVEDAAKIGRDDREDTADGGQGPVTEKHDTPSPTPSLAELARPVAERNRKQFTATMDRFIEKLASPEFAAACTATRLRQAVAFPVAAAVLGRERAWADDDAVLRWVRTAADLLLYGPNGTGSFLETVGARYEGERAEAFQAILGDGVLWTVFAAALSAIPWPGAAGALHRLVLLADLWEADILRAGASGERLAYLARRYRAEDAVGLIRNVALPSAEVLTPLERRLAEVALDLFTDPAFVRPRVRAGDVLWGPGSRGWALAVGDEDEKGAVQAYRVRSGSVRKLRMDPDHYVRLEDAAARDGEVARGVVALRELLVRMVDG